VSLRGSAAGVERKARLIRHLSDDVFLRPAAFAGCGVGLKAIRDARPGESPFLVNGPPSGACVHDAYCLHPSSHTTKPHRSFCHVLLTPVLHTIAHRCPAQLPPSS
jgi:hypothetical protein